LIFSLALSWHHLNLKYNVLFICVANMPLSNKERQRMYRLRRDSSPSRRAAYLQNKKAKYKDDLRKGKRKKVADMTNREMRAQRKEWRHRQQKCRRTRSCESVAIRSSPPKDDESVPIVSSTVSTTPSSVRGRKRVQRNRSALYRENMILWIYPGVISNLSGIRPSYPA